MKNATKNTNEDLKAIMGEGQDTFERRIAYANTSSAGLRFNRAEAEHNEREWSKRDEREDWQKQFIG